MTDQNDDKEYRRRCVHHIMKSRKEILDEAFAELDRSKKPKFQWLPFIVLSTLLVIAIFMLARFSR